MYLLASEIEKNYEKKLATLINDILCIAKDIIVPPNKNFRLLYSSMQMPNNWFRTLIFKSELVNFT